MPEADTISCLELSKGVWDIRTDVYLVHSYSTTSAFETLFGS